MILQSLITLYDRRARLGADEDSGPAPVGFEWKAIPFVIVVDRNGGFVSLQDTRRVDGKKLVPSSEMVPAGVKKTSGIAANLLWDTAEYVLGVETEIKNKVAKPERIREQHLAFRARLGELPESVRHDEGLAAVLAFLDNTEARDQLRALPDWETLRTSNPLLSFRLQHDSELVCQRETVRSWWLAQVGGEEADGTCLVTGEAAVIERLHPAIKNVWGAQSSGANLVSFNLDAFASYGKEQGANAPIGKPAAAKYTTALNDLLKDERHRIQVGDASTVFWAEEVQHPIESAFAALFGVKKKDDPTQSIEYIKQVFDSVRAGKLAEHGKDSRFHVLALAPNAARLSVRFWHTATVDELSPRFQRHLNDLDIVRPKFELETPNLFRLLLSCALLRKAENVPPNLGGEVMQAVLADRPYPQTLFAAALRRCRAEQDVDYARAAILKACINRSKRSRPDGGKELTVTLDPDNNTRAYLLGQLFMILERIQEEAMGDINRTIRDTYWGAAQANPQRTFPKLVDLALKHLKKMRREKGGRAVNLEKLLTDRVARLGSHDPFPPSFRHDELGTFIVGYYHQRQSDTTYKTAGSKES